MPANNEDPKLEAVLARLCERLGDLWTMQAVKLPYLVDLVAHHVCKRPITTSAHKAWEHGVVTARAWGLMKKAKGGDHFEVYGEPFVDGLRLKCISAPDVDLTTDEREIVDFVADSFGALSTNDLAALTKDINPGVSAWGGKKAMQLTADAYERLPIWFKEEEADLKRVSEIAKTSPEPISGAEAEELLAEWRS